MLLKHDRVERPQAGSGRDEIARLFVMAKHLHGQSIAEVKKGSQKAADPHTQSKTSDMNLSFLNESNHSPASISDF